MPFGGRPMAIMKRAAGWWLCAALGGFGPMAPAQTDPEAAFLGLLKAKLAASFAAPATLGTGPTYLLLSPAGLPLTAAQLADPYELSVALDQIPQTAETFSPSGLTYSGVFGALLRGAKVSAYQDQAELEQVHLIKRTVWNRTRHGQPTADYAAYLKYQGAYAAAVDARALAQAEQQASGQAAPGTLDGAVDRAMRDWVALGHKDAFDAAFARLEGFYQHNVGAIFKEAGDDLLLAAIQDGHPSPYYPVLADPPFSAWLSDPGWQDWRFQTADAKVPAGSAALPAARRGPQAGRVHPEWLGSLSVTARLKRVRLTRAWLDPRILKSRAWDLLPASGLTAVAAGDPGVAAPGPMPLLVTGLLLARDLTVAGAWEDTSGQEAPPAAVGPFALASPASAPGLPLQPFVTTDHGELNIQVEGAQIIGWFCEAVPKCPNPDPKFFR